MPLFPFPGGHGLQMDMTQTSCPASEPAGSTCYKADTSVQVGGAWACRAWVLYPKQVGRAAAAHGFWT